MSVELLATGRELKTDFVSVVATYSTAIRQIQKHTRIKSERLLYELGETFGYALADEISAKDLDGILKEMFSIWRRLKLGRASIKQKDPLTISVQGCYGCEQIPNEGEAIDCTFREGILKAVIDRKLGANSSVRHISSYGKVIGKKRCWFVIIEIDSKVSSTKNVN